MADETSETREVGTESISCPNCGKSLPPVEQADGATAYQSCSKCYPKPTKTVVKEQAELQQAGVFPARETGTNTEEASNG